MHEAIISLGVKNYHMVKLGCCGHVNCTSSLKISFHVEGDFIAAALSDELHRTVDYDSLCQAIHKTILLKSPDLLILRKVILNFSDLITGGYVAIEVRCPHAFLKDHCLL